MEGNRSAARRENVGAGRQVMAARRSFTRLARFFNQLLREQLTCGPLTIQQFTTLEVLDGGPRGMSDLATQVGLHQSTMTRIVDRLERDGYVERKRDPTERRAVEVGLTVAGKRMYRHLDEECTIVTTKLLDVLPAGRRGACVEALDALTRALDPENEGFRRMLRGCCSARKEEGG